MERKRVNVGVYAVFSAEGGMTPLEIVWPDGRRFGIDRVTSVLRAPGSVNTVLPVRYTCAIRGAVRELFFEPQAEVWFVEAKI